MSVDQESAKRFVRDKAVALNYSSIDKIPHVVANVSGELARRLVELAKDKNIPVHEDSWLAELLGQLEVGTQVTPETFHAVAEVISFVYYLDREWAKSHGFLEGVLQPEDPNSE